MSEIYDQLIVRKANQHVQSRLNAAVPTLDSAKSREGLVKQQQAKIKEMARQAVVRAKREEAEERVKAEGRPPTDEDFRVDVSLEEIQAASIEIAAAIVRASDCQHMIDQQTLEGLRRGV